MREPDLFAIVDDFFSDVERYDPDCTSVEETLFRISEQTLRKQAQKTLDALQEYERNSGTL